MCPIAVMHGHSTLMSNVHNCEISGVAAAVIGHVIAGLLFMDLCVVGSYILISFSRHAPRLASYINVVAMLERYFIYR